MAADASRSVAGAARVVAFAAALVSAWGASPAAAQERFAAVQAGCIACHGANAAAEVPALGGMDAYYALLQLVAFREGQRENEVMNALMADFSDDDLRAAADWVATLPAPEPPADAADPALVEAGAALGETHRCSTCHGADYLGGHQMPPLRNQREAYVLKSLNDYKAERRIGDRAAMVEVAQALTDEEIETLARYVARLD